MRSINHKRALFGSVSIIIVEVQVILIIVVIVFVWFIFLLADSSHVHVSSCRLYTLSVLVEVLFQNFTVTFKTEDLDGGEDIFAVDGFSFLVFTFFTGFTSDEGDEFGDALLDGFLGIFGDFGVLGEGLFHDTTDVGNG
jgi:hypothetical protein